MKKFVLMVALLSIPLSSTNAKDLVNHYAQGVKAEAAGDFMGAVDQFRKASLTGGSDAIYAVGRNYVALGDTANAYEWYLRAARASNRFAQHELAMLYVTGAVEDSGDSIQSKKWLTLAANDGLAVSAYQLFLLTNESLWLVKGAEKGHAQSMSMLAEAYGYGLYGFEQNVEQQQYWLEQRAETSESEQYVREKN